MEPVSPVGVVPYRALLPWCRIVVLYRVVPYRGAVVPSRPAPHFGLEAAPYLDPKAFSLRWKDFIQSVISVICLQFAENLISEHIGYRSWFLSVC